MNNSGRLVASIKDPERRQWCGPTALAAITGFSYDEMVARIEGVREAKFVNLAYLHELRSVLDDLGYNIEHRPLYRELKHLPTLWQLITRRSAAERQSFILALVTHHFVAIQGDEICDSAYSGHRPIKVSALSKGQKWKRVREYLIVTPMF